MAVLLVNYHTQRASLIYSTLQNRYKGNLKLRRGTKSLKKSKRRKLVSNAATELNQDKSLLIMAKQDP